MVRVRRKFSYPARRGAGPDPVAEGSGPFSGVRHLPAATALAVLAFADAPAAYGHAGERGFVMLLPTGLFQAGGTAAVAVSFLVVAWFRGAALRRAMESLRWRAIPAPRALRGTNAAAATLLVVLVVAGLAGSRDPLANPLPLAVWTLLWVGLTFVHAVFGYVWPHLDPWRPLASLVRRILLRSDDTSPPLPWPRAFDRWPAVLLLLLFAWFELVFSAPRDPAVLAVAVTGYSLFTIAGMTLFGYQTWTEKAEIFSCFFRMVSALAPLRITAENARRRLTLTLPGSRLPGIGELPAAGLVFVVCALATVSFDGLSRTFWWLDLGGFNPLEHPGRTALVAWNTFGLLAAAAGLLAASALCTLAGARWSGSPAPAALRRFVVSIIPIAFGYHFAHYLPSFLVDVQYAYRALSDPMAQGWNLLGAGDFHVTASFLTHHASVEAIWYVQVSAIVVAHVVAVVVLHALAGEIAGGRKAQVLSQLPLTILMVAYTLFGLWLLSTPVAA